MEWKYMTPAWLLPDGVAAVGLDAGGGSTDQLLVASGS